MSSDRNPKGAGRKDSSGPYGEKTQSIRLPESFVTRITPELNLYKQIRASIKKDKSLTPKLRQAKLQELGDCFHWLLNRFSTASNTSTKGREPKIGSQIEHPMIELPCYPVAATPDSSGFADEASNEIKILKHLVQNPKNSFLARVSGDSMSDLNIQSGHILVVERIQDASKLKRGHIVIASMGTGSQVVKVFHPIDQQQFALVSANKSVKYETIYSKEDSQDNIIFEGIVKQYGFFDDDDFPEQWSNNGPTSIHYAPHYSRIDPTQWL